MGPLYNEDAGEEKARPTTIETGSSDAFHFSFHLKEGGYVVRDDRDDRRVNFLSVGNLNYRPKRPVTHIGLIPLVKGHPTRMLTGNCMARPYLGLEVLSSNQGRLKGSRPRRRNRKTSKRPI